MYSNELKRVNYHIYDDFKMKKTIWSPWFIQKYCSVGRVKPYCNGVYHFLFNEL